jgi:hypothetical protein
MTQENQNPHPEQENTAEDAVSEASAQASVPLTPEEEIAELNQKLADLQDHHIVLASRTLRKAPKWAPNADISAAITNRRLVPKRSNSTPTSICIGA